MRLLPLRFSYQVQIRSQLTVHHFGCSLPKSNPPIHHESTYRHLPPYAFHGYGFSFFLLMFQSLPIRHDRLADITERSDSSVGYPDRSNSYGQICSTDGSDSLLQDLLSGQILLLSYSVQEGNPAYLCRPGMYVYSVLLRTLWSIRRKFSFLWQVLHGPQVQ